MCKKFAENCVNNSNERVKNIFQVREKNHPMNMRNEEIYVVKNANTERLMKSSIPYMQRMLNYEDRKRKEFDQERLTKKKRKPG